MKPNISCLIGIFIITTVYAFDFKKALSSVTPAGIPSLTEESDGPRDCYDLIGCFATGNPWHSIVRPIPKPWGPKNISASVTLFTRQAPQGFIQHLNDEINLDKSDYNPNRPKTVYISHGFASNGRFKWLLDLKDAYLKNVDANVFVVDWGQGATLINYLQVASNTRIVGAQLGRLTRYLIGKGQSTKNMHLIGHSLGSHIMSYCAKSVSEISKIDRITALDPAQPGFEGLPKIVRLDRSDAENIDVIHTDAKPFIPFLGFGMLAPVGTVDFYLNGGSLQPGCFNVEKPNITSLADLVKYPVEVVATWVACSHGRSYEYFTAALNHRNCSFWGRKMSSVENFLKIGTLGRLALADPVVSSLSDCTKDTCTYMGLDTFSQPGRGSFAVVTNNGIPFCKTSDEEMRHLKNLVTLGLYDKIPKLGRKLFHRT